MNGFWHGMECEVIVEPSRSDRFYMDMRVYRIVQAPAPAPDDSDDSTLWRGIFLAVEMEPTTDKSRRSRKP